MWNYGGIAATLYLTPKGDPLYAGSLSIKGQAKIHHNPSVNLPNPTAFKTASPTLRLASSPRRSSLVLTHPTCAQRSLPDTAHAGKVEPKFHVLGHGYAFCGLNTRTDDHSASVRIITLELESDPYSRDEIVLMTGFDVTAI